MRHNHLVNTHRYAATNNRLALLIVALVLLLVCMPDVWAQTQATSTGMGTATNAGNTQALTVVNQGNAIKYPAASLGSTVIAPPAVQQTCDSAGYGFGGNNYSGSAILSLPGKTEEGCDTGRDINMVTFVEKQAGSQDSIEAKIGAINRARICRKSTIRQAYEDSGDMQACANVKNDTRNLGTTGTTNAGYLPG